MRHLSRRETIAGVLFTLPFIVGFFAFAAYPIGASVYYSLTNYNIMQSPVFIGLENYRALFVDPLFWKALLNTVYFTFVSVPLQVVVAFFLALLLNTRLYGRSLFRALYFFPTVVPSVVTGVLWTAILNPQGGLANVVLHALHIPGPNWLGSTAWAMPALILVSVWGCGSTIVIFIAGLQDVPKQLLEAAELDGAGGWPRLIKVIVPLVSPVILFNFIINLIGAFQIFTLPYVMTGGGPLNATLVYSMYLYDNAFSEFRMGYASALAWILFLIIFGLTLVSLRVSRGSVYYES